MLFIRGTRYSPDDQEFDTMNTLSKNLRTLYLTGLLVGSLLLLLVLFMNNWNLQTLMNSAIIMSLIGISGTAMKFLSGLGIMLTYATVCSVVFKTTSKSMKRSPNTAKAVKILLLVPIGAIAIYAIYKLYLALLLSETLSLIETIVAVYGIWSLVIMVYAVPLVRKQYDPKFQSGAIDDAKGRLGEVKHTLWKGYQLRVHGDYGTVYAREFERYQDRINLIRVRLSAILLPALCIVLSIFPPLAGLIIILWIRTLLVHEQPISVYERLLLVVIVLAVLLISTAIFFLFEIAPLLVYFDTAYSLGIIASILVLAFVVATS
ncbi:MAG: hypothetical protein RTU92_00480 [Candidatus Thorarchaeota archaeon]